MISLKYLSAKAVKLYGLVGKKLDSPILSIPQSVLNYLDSLPNPYFEVPCPSFSKRFPKIIIIIIHLFFF